MATSATDSSHPYYPEIKELKSGEIAGFFRDKPERMKFVSLGELLDLNSFGGMNYVVWPSFTVRQMVGFIDGWMRAQPLRIEYVKVPSDLGPGIYRFEEGSREEGYLWNRFHQDFDEKLPIIDESSCRIGRHTSKIKDLNGILRCNEFQNNVDSDTTKCLEIISEGDITLPLESVLLRLSVGDPNVSAIFPFSGFSVAGYTKAWWNQQGKKELFLPRGMSETYRVHKNFEFVSSEE